MSLKTPFRLLVHFVTILHVVTIFLYNHLLHYCTFTQLHVNLFTLSPVVSTYSVSLYIFTYSHFEISPLTANWLGQVKVKVTLRLTVSQSVSLGVEPHLGLMTRYLLLSDSYRLVFVGRPLWREDGSVFCICCRPLPAQSWLGLKSKSKSHCDWRSVSQ
jgi:hypothetical protein